MKILLVSTYGGINPLGYRLTKEGHNVTMYVKHPADKHAGDASIKKVEDWTDHVNDADLILFGDLDMLKKPNL